MDFGVFSDIHSNLAALEAVWSSFKSAALTERVVLNAGDNVGYGDSPEECIQFLRSHPEIVTVQGNYDRHVAMDPERQADFRKKWGQDRPEKVEAIRQDSLRISDDSRRWLLELPKESVLDMNGVSVLLTHYSPGGKEGIGPWTSDARLLELSERTDAQVVVCGHTHAPFVRRAGRVLFVNPGTVGRPLFGSSSSAVLTLVPDKTPTARLSRGGRL